MNIWPEITQIMILHRYYEQTTHKLSIFLHNYAEIDAEITQKSWLRKLRKLRKLIVLSILRPLCKLWKLEKKSKMSDKIG